MNTKKKKKRKLKKYEIKGINRAKYKKYWRDEKRNWRAWRKRELVVPKPKDPLEAKDYLERIEETKGNGDCKDALALLRRAVTGTKLLDPRRIGMEQLGRTDTNNYVFALTALAAWSKWWIRDPGEWKPRSKNDRRQFKSLVRHLMGYYHVPGFMDCAWFTDGAEGELHRVWYFNMGRGRNINLMSGVPFRVTKKIAHYFMGAPDDVTIEQALVWGKVIAMGGNAKIASGVVGTRIAEDFEHVDFWDDVIKFFITEPGLDTVHYGPIVDYLNNEKFVDRGWRMIDGLAVHLGPRRPHLSMKGRTAKNLLAAVERWHRELASSRKSSYYWPSCGIPGSEWVEGKGVKARIFKIKELTSAEELRYEGRKMSHCVAIYDHACKSGRCAIFSLRVTDSKRRDHPVLTMTVVPKNRMIVEARGKCNVYPTDRQRKYVEQWASAVGLSVAGRVWG